MEWVTLFPETDQPAPDDIRGYIANPLWDELLAYIRDTYGVQPTFHFSGCGMQPGWNIKCRKGGKALCTLYPKQGMFIALVVVGAKEMAEAELLVPSCTLHVQTLFRETPLYNHTKWLSIEVTSKDVLSDVEALMCLRVPPEK